MIFKAKWEGFASRRSKPGQKDYQLKVKPERVTNSPNIILVSTREVKVWGVER